MPPPLGLGRGRHYDQRHLETLRRIQGLQSAGHSLDAIGKILNGQDLPAAASDAVTPPPAPLAATRRTELAAELWTRLRLAPGFELHFDAAEHPSADQLLQIRRAVRRILEIDDDDEETDTQQRG